VLQNLVIATYDRPLTQKGGKVGLTIREPPWSPDPQPPLPLRLRLHSGPLSFSR
jgi:hypothetical protein